ncbi:hypothetical protein D3C72_2423520 [compost metagenome]
MAAFVIAGALSWIGRWYQEDGDYTAEQVIDQCVEQLLCGVLMPVSAGEAATRKPGIKKAPVRARSTAPGA